MIVTKHRHWPSVMCVHMCVYIYVYMYICIYIYTHMHTCIHTFIYVCIYIYIYMYRERERYIYIYREIDIYTTLLVTCRQSLLSREDEHMSEWQCVGVYCHSNRPQVWGNLSTGRQAEAKETMMPLALADKSGNSRVA